MEFEAVIGLEIHAQVSTKTKMFCGCDNDSFGKAANVNVCPICMGFPGMLPVCNKEAIEKAVIAARALGCEIPEYSKFDRKNYFYPDLTNGFQISQFDQPISQNGELSIELEGKELKIGITRLHIENDAGKLTHTASGTLLDYNRAGTPLMEIVSEPDMRSAQEAKAYAESVQKILRYCGSSDCDMEKGMMRFDASISIREKGSTELNPRAEIKNLNSFRSLEIAIEHEIERQIALWKEGEPLSGDETRGWDEERLTTRLLRDKESAADYRYFPEPDLPPIEVSREQLQDWEKQVPELPDEKRKRFMSDYQLKEQDALFYSEDRELAELFESVASSTKEPALAHSFIGTILVGKLKEEHLKLIDSKITTEQLTELIELIKAGTISNNVAKSTVFEKMWTEGSMPKAIVESEGLVQVSDEGELESICQEVIEANPKAAEDVRAGQMKAIGSLVGGVMKASQGKANPKMVNDILKRLLLQ